MFPTTLLVALTALLFAGTPTVHAAPTLLPNLTPPSQDPFYAVPSDIGKYKPGHVLRQRQINPSYFGPEAKAAYQIFYRTTGVDQPTGTVTTVVLPVKPAQGVPRLVALGEPEDSAGLACSPSYAFVAGPLSPNSIEISGDVTRYGALHQGWYLTIPDHEGPQSAFLAGHVSGHGMLDAIRATKNAGKSLGIPNANQAQSALLGYSGGAQATGWAAQLSSTYAPELDIVGWVAGGLPANITENFSYLDGTIQAGLDFLGSAGIGNAYPQFNELLSKHAKPNTTALYKGMRDGTICLDGAAVFANAVFDFSFDIPSISGEPVFVNTVAEQTLGINAPAITRFPVLLAHSMQDGTVPYDQSAKFVKTECAEGASIEYISLPSGSHGQVASSGTPSFIQRLIALFDGQVPLTHKCNTITSLPVPPIGLEAVSLMGPIGYAALLQQIVTAGGPVS